jgi:uncharacterized protein YutE (UPF0331/DUF86 family)
VSPVEKEVIRRKLAVITENLKALEPIRGMPAKEYFDNVYKRKAAERLLQELIEAAIDINTHVIVQTGGAAPDDYYESFIRAAEFKIISPELAEKLAPSAGLRNRLVHEYDFLDHAMVLDAVSIVEELFPYYVKEVEDYISGRI